MSSPLLFAAAPGVLAWLATDGAARHAVDVQLLTAGEARMTWRAPLSQRALTRERPPFRRRTQGGDVAALGAPLRVAAGDGDTLEPLAGGRAADARTGRYDRRPLLCRLVKARASALTPRGIAGATRTWRCCSAAPAAMTCRCASGGWRPRLLRRAGPPRATCTSQRCRCRRARRRPSRATSSTARCCCLRCRCDALLLALFRRWQNAPRR